MRNNAVFGKTMENIRKHRNFKLVTSEAQYLKTVMKPNVKSGVHVDENLMGWEMGRIKVVMNKPVYLGQAILDLSKIVMCEFHYDYMTQKYSSDRLRLRGAGFALLRSPRLLLCYMDTDSLVHRIQTD